jgi:hypothetical protein
MDFGPDYTMVALMGGITEFLANPIVIGGVVLALSLKLGPKALQALKSVVGRG